MSNASTSSVGDISVDEPPLTASAIVAPPIMSGSHILCIDGYSRTTGLGSSKYISSETFTVGGHHWCLRYYPDGLGYCPNRSDWISFMLHCDLTNPDQGVKARVTISLLDLDGNRVPSHSTGSMAWTFCDRHGEAGAGFPLIKRSRLEGSPYLKDDVFCVRCDISVTKIFTKAVAVSDVGRRAIEQEQRDATSPLCRGV
ncbi:hypothetical protein VPH35_125275 [Triticum aestivum]